LRRSPESASDWPAQPRTSVLSAGLRPPELELAVLWTCSERSSRRQFQPIEVVPTVSRLATRLRAAGRCERRTWGSCLAPLGLRRERNGRRPRIPGLRCAPTWALESRPFGARIRPIGHPKRRSIPHVALVELDVVATEESAKFVLERLDAVMLVLVFDVALHASGIRRAY
jgi:hypothetical protein